MRGGRRISGRTAYLALALIATLVIALGLSSSRSTRADDPSGERVLRPMGPENQLTWSDDSPIRLVGGGETGAGKESLKRAGGGGATDSAVKPQDGPCSCAPVGR